MFVRQEHVAEPGDLPRPRRLAQGQGWRVVRLAVPPGQAVPTHTAPGTVVLAVVVGPGRIQVGDQEEVLAPGDVAVCPPGTPHGLTALPDQPLVVLVTVIQG